MSVRRLPVFLLFLFAIAIAMAQVERHLCVVTWNVENVFDTLHDEGFNDYEFLPHGERRWNSYRYWHKLNDIGRVVSSINAAGSIPDLIGLCEVENDSVIAHLTRRSLMRNLGYEYVITNSSDPRGIDVALLYQPVRFRVLEKSSINVSMHAREKSLSHHSELRSTRDILYVKGLSLTTAGPDTLHVLVVHLPSRAGGRSGDRLRRIASSVLWNVVDSILVSSSSLHASSPEPRIIVMGDFNATARDRIFKSSPLFLTDDTSLPGTYCFRGFWQWIDHILVSKSLACHGLSYPVELPWLLEPNKSYGGFMPRRSFRGPSYHGGVSDHLPVVLHLDL